MLVSLGVGFSQSKTQKQHKRPDEDRLRLRTSLFGKALACSGYCAATQKVQHAVVVEVFLLICLVGTHDSPESSSELTGCVLLFLSLDLMR